MDNWSSHLRYAIVFDMDTKALKANKVSLPDAYTKIKQVMEANNYISQQKSVYFGQSDEEDASKCIQVIQMLGAIYSWFDICVKDIQMLVIEAKSDLKPNLFTKISKMNLKTAKANKYKV